MSIRKSRKPGRAAQPLPELTADTHVVHPMEEGASEPPHIIRSRISHEMAFPVGYELFREHFSSAPRWFEAQFRFSAHPTTFASEFTRVLRDQEPYRILRLEHRTPIRPSMEQIAQWHFEVCPVPRKLKSVARATLIDQSFPLLREFMNRCPTHWNYYNRCDVIFDPVEGTCRVAQLWAF